MPADAMEVVDTDAAVAVTTFNRVRQVAPSVQHTVAVTTAVLASARRSSRYLVSTDFLPVVALS